MKIAKKTVADTFVSFAFANGHVLTCDVDDLNDDITARLALHGMSQKIGDSYASSESVDAAIAAATEVWENLKKGIWATRATGGKLAAALSRATGKPIEDCIGKLATMDDKAKAGLRKHPDIKRALAEIELEAAEKAAKAATDADTGELTGLFE